MQNITVVGLSYPSHRQTTVLFNGTTVTLDNGVSTIDSLAGNGGEDGDDGAPAALQNITVGGVGAPYNSLANVICNGTTATLDTCV